MYWIGLIAYQKARRWARKQARTNRGFDVRYIVICCIKWLINEITRIESGLVFRETCYCCLAYSSEPRYIPISGV